jgi:predicted TIM-barrel fold metal-dependent hydrolase
VAAAGAARAVRLYPNDHRYVANRTTLGPLLDELARRGWPVFVDKGQFGGDWSAIEAFLRAFPDNRVVLLDAYWSDWRCVLPLLEACPNLHLDLALFQANRAPEVLVGRCGSERFLFGTGAPAMSPGAARGFLDWSDLDEADAAAMAHGNLQRLLGLEAVPTAVKEPADDLVAAAWRGEALTATEVLDAHAHVVHEGGDGVGLLTQLQGDVTHLRRHFARCGIRQTVASSWLAIYAPEPRLGNDVTWRAMQAEPAFFHGYACLDPVQMSAAESAAEIDLRHRQQGFIGLKPYVQTSAAFDDPAYAPWYEVGNELHLFALFHNQYEVAGRLAPRYPELTFLLAHTGGSMATAKAAADVAEGADNILCELTLTPVTNGAIEYLVQRLGAAKVLFGTDAPMRDPRPQLGWVVHAALSREDKAAVLGGNCARLLARPRNRGGATPA